MIDSTVRPLNLEPLEDRALPADVGFFGAPNDLNIFAASEAIAMSRPRPAATSSFLAPSATAVVVFRAPDVPVIHLNHNSRTFNDPHTVVSTVRNSPPPEESFLEFRPPVVTPQSEPLETLVELAEPVTTTTLTQMPTAPGPAAIEDVEISMAAVSGPWLSGPWSEEFVAKVDVDSWEQSATQLLEGLESAARDPGETESLWVRIGYWAVSIGAVGLAIELTRQGFRVRSTNPDTPELVVR